MYGGSGNDNIRGRRGDNENDQLYGGAGVDRLQGGNGNDTLLFDPGVLTETEFGFFLALEDSKVTGGSGIDTLQGSAGNDLIDFSDAALFADIEIVRSGAGDDLILGAMDTTLADQFLIFGGDGDDIVSFFAVTTTNFDLSHVDPSFNSTTGAWTIDYTANGAKSVTLSQAEVVASAGGDVGNWDPSAGLSGNFPGSPNFLSANYIDGGSGVNTLFGAVGGPKWDDVPRDQRPEAGLLRLRKDLDLFANLRPAVVMDAMVDASTLKPEVVKGLDIMILRELTSGVYFGEPKGEQTLEDGNTDTGGYSNGLIFFEGFEGDDNVTIDYEDAQANDLGVGTADVNFVNNADGTWTISFTSSTGSVTFAGHEISDINLQDNKEGGTGGITTSYRFNDQGTASFADDTYDLQ